MAKLSLDGLGDIDGFMARHSLKGFETELDFS